MWRGDERNGDKVKNSEDINDIDSSCTNDESEDGKSDTSHNDQDSDVSFEIDNDEEIDAAEIEEEEWVEYIKRSTSEALENGKWEDRMLEYDSKKNEVEIGDENLPHHRMWDGCLKLLNGIHNSAQNT